jgi:hypothetical protein
MLSASLNDLRIEEVSFFSFVFSFRLDKNDPRSHTKAHQQTSSPSCIFVDRFAWQATLLKLRFSIALQ